MSQRDSEKIKILFLCTGNSCRSQMAEGWGKKLKGNQLEVYSAGIEKHGLNPLAVKAHSRIKKQLRVTHKRATLRESG